jgi:hypothetical protein
MSGPNRDKWQDFRICHNTDRRFSFLNGLLQFLDIDSSTYMHVLLRSLIELDEIQERLGSHFYSV